jgi:hypothetical protein
MGGDKAQRGVDVQIALLEAQLGILPNIQWCAGAAKNPKFKRGSVAGKNSAEMQQELAALRLLKTRQKLFWVKNEIGRDLKKAKAFCVRKLIRKIKSAEPGAPGLLEQKLRDAKDIKHLQEADHFYDHFIHCNENEYLRDKFAQLGLRDSALPTTAPSPILASLKIIKDTLNDLEAELVQFLRKLFHDQETGRIPREEDGEDQAGNIEARPGESFFINSLNPAHERKRRFLSEEGHAEAKYGQEAKHLRLSTDRVRRPTRHAPPQETKKDMVHPSWQAKQQAKEREKLACFQGTKMTFASSSDNDE